MHIPPLIHAGARIGRLAASETVNRRAWAGAAATLEDGPVRELKHEAGTRVFRARILDRNVVVKRWELSTVALRLKSLAGSSRAFRHWRGAQALEARGVATARCLALLTLRRKGPPRQYLVMEALDGPTVLECLARPSLIPRQEHNLSRAIARQIVALTLGGYYNRDHKPSNLIVRNADSPEPTVAIIDTVAINKLRFWRRADLYAMFASLIIEPLGCGCPPRCALMMRVLVEHQRELLRRIPNLLPPDPAVRRHARHLDWMRIAGIIDAHGDPTPRINPLS